MTDVTRLLEQIAGGDRQAAADLLPLVYDELRRLAARRMEDEKAGQTLEPTALVHEAFLRVSPATFENRRHFFASVAEAMQRILIENARRKGRRKRGSGLRRVALPEVAAVAGLPSDELLDLTAAIDAFAAADPRRSELVRLRFFAGLSLEEAADCLRVSRATANRQWTYARAWLQDRLKSLAPETDSEKTPDC